MKALILVVALLISGTAMAADANACRAYEANRNQTLPSHINGSQSILDSVHCLNRGKGYAVTLTFSIRVPGINAMMVSDAEKTIWSQQKEAQVRSTLCPAMKTEYWFADSLIGSYYDLNGNSLGDLFIHRNECN